MLRYALKDTHLDFLEIFARRLDASSISTAILLPHAALREMKLDVNEARFTNVGFRVKCIKY